MKAHFLEPDDRLHRFRNSSEKKLFYTDPRGVGTVESVEANYEFLLGWYATVLGDGELPSFGVMKARIESKLIMQTNSSWDISLCSKHTCVHPSGNVSIYVVSYCF